jgi:hypothetical protein
MPKELVHYVLLQSLSSHSLRILLLLCLVHVAGIAVHYGLGGPGFNSR